MNDRLFEMHVRGMFKLWLLTMIDVCIGMSDAMLIVRCMISVCELHTSIECAFNRVKI